MMLRLILLTLAASAIIASLLQPAQAQQMIRFSSGTGFFVSVYGQIITNAHVVKGCDMVSIRGAVDEMPARVIEVDEENDLALLHADTTPPNSATLSTSPIGVQKGDKVMVIGYPMDHGLTGDYVVKESEILDSKGPLNEPKWLQFSDSAQQGNSGGPLLDTSGHVVGVITAKSQLMMYNPVSGETTKVRDADVAVSLPVLIRFLEQHRVYFNRSSYITRYNTDYVESRAKDFIVNIHCPQAETVQDVH